MATRTACSLHAVLSLAFLLVAEASHPKESRVHAFFYLWYGTPQVDGSWRHWDHSILEHWSTEVQTRHAVVKDVHFVPPLEVHSPYYPARGLYSSRNETVLTEQLQQLVDAGVTTVVLSWWGRPDIAGTHDSQGINTDDAIAMVLDAAHEVGATVALHLEPYHARTAETVRHDFEYLKLKYGDHPGLLKMARRGTDMQKLPVYYLYDSYRIPASEWRRLLASEGDLSVRGSQFDALTLALWLDGNAGHDIVSGHFDGFYTYFSATGFTYGSTLQNWPTMASFAKANKLLFVPSVGPGYDDTKIRPWNRENIRDRQNGRYYDVMWQAALDASADLVSITSYNEWGEGTQIEPAVPMHVPAAEQRMRKQALEHLGLLDRVYADYVPHSPTFYMEKTAQWVRTFVDAVAIRGVERGEL